MSVRRIDDIGMVSPGDIACTGRHDMTGLRVIEVDPQHLTPVDICHPTAKRYPARLRIDPRDYPPAGSGWLRDKAFDHALRPEPVC